MENEKFNQQDLWGFKDINELEVAQDMPDLILKQQLELLKRKTHGILHVKTDVVHVEDKSEYNFTLATRYDIVVPNLDNYSKTVFVLYSSLERIYPVMITDDKKFHEVLKRIYQGDMCYSKLEFESKLRKVFSSQKLMDIVRILYTKGLNASK